MNSKAKGKRGELEAAEQLRKLFGCSARRGQQYAGSPDSPDVVHDIPGLHFEVKRTQKLELYRGLLQAANDAQNGQIPVILHKKNRQPWVVILTLDDFARVYNGEKLDGEET